jgi:sigma-B regulation protein RsbU (phosphoserine phosphatase)
MSRRRRFAVLVALALCAATYQGFYAWQCVQMLRHDYGLVARPFDIDHASATIQKAGDSALRAGIVAGDRILAIDGEVYSGSAVLWRRLRTARPGDAIQVTLARATNPTVEVRLVPRTPQRLRTVLIVVIGIAMQVVCLLLGFGVAARRPTDARAWILLMLMLSFSQKTMDVVDVSAWPSPVRAPALLWHTLLGMAWPIWMLLFGLHFPERLSLDRRWPWLKWLVLGPLVIQCLVGGIWATANVESVELSARIRPLVGSVMVAPKLFVTLAISGFFAILGTRSGMAKSLDARRRLKLLFAGANVSLLPLGVLFITGALTGREVGDFPAWLVLPALLLVALFPVTLAYVIVVQQAMDVRVVLRQGLHYAAYQSLPHFVRFWKYQMVPPISAPKGADIANEYVIN